MQLIFSRATTPSRRSSRPTERSDQGEATSRLVPGRRRRRRRSARARARDRPGARAGHLLRLHQLRTTRITSFEVTGEAGEAELPEGEGTVTAFEYSFEAEGLEAGTNQILFDNTGAEPHHVVAFPIIGNAKIEDVKTFFKTEKGKPPVAFEQGARPP